MHNCLKIKSRTGQSIVEYGLLIALISVICMTVLVDGLGGELKKIANSVINGLNAADQLSQQSTGSTST